jgi:tripartite-type tricarboxylate transporter receptor subunit TctC
MTRRFERRALLAAAGGLLAAPASAQEAWPARPIRVIVPFAPGGTSDLLARLAANEMSRTLGQSVVAENRAGAGGVLGTQLALRAPPDGYTLVISGIATLVVVPALNPAAGYDPLRDFAHVGFLGGPPTALVVTNNHPAHTLADLIRIGREGLPIHYGSPGSGTHAHLIGEAFAQVTGTRMEHIPYRGAGVAITDLIGGTLPAGSMTFSSAASAIRAGQVRALALTSANRLPGFDIPTFAELGFPQLTAMTWFGLSAPAGTPAAIVERLNREAQAALATPRSRERMEADNVESLAMDAAGYTRFVQAEFEKWAPIARASGARID